MAEYKDPIDEGVILFYLIGAIFVSGAVGSITSAAYGCIVLGGLVILLVLLNIYFAAKRNRQTGG